MIDLSKGNKSNKEIIIILIGTQGNKRKGFCQAFW
jgi:hypothetical protein